MTEVAQAASGNQGAVAPQGSEAPVAPKADAPLTRKLKIDGQEIEVNVDEALKDYSKFKAADKRFQEAAKYRREAEQKEQYVNSLIGAAKNGDLSWLKGLVPQATLNKWAESELLQHLEYERLPEPEKRARAAEAETKQYKQYLENLQAEQQKAQLTQLEAKAAYEIETDIVSAVKALGYPDYKVTPRLIRRMAEDMYASLTAQNPEDPSTQPISAMSAKDRAFQSLMDDAVELLSILPAEKSLSLIPPKLIDAIRRRDVEQVQANLPAKFKGQDKPISIGKKNQPRSIASAFDQIEQRLGKG